MRGCYCSLQRCAAQPAAAPRHGRNSAACQYQRRQKSHDHCPATGEQPWTARDTERSGGSRALPAARRLARRREARVEALRPAPCSTAVLRRLQEGTRTLPTGRGPCPAPAACSQHGQAKAILLPPCLPLSVTGVSACRWSLPVASARRRAAGACGRERGGTAVVCDVRACVIDEAHYASASSQNRNILPAMLDGNTGMLRQPSHLQTSCSPLAFNQEVAAKQTSPDICKKPITLLHLPLLASIYCARPSA